MASAAQATELKVVGQSGQISLGKRYAGKALRVEHREDGTIELTPVALVPERHLWTTQSPHKERIERGMAWAAGSPRRETDLHALAARAERARPSSTGKRGRKR